MKKQTVLFICSYNSVRSPMAEGLLRKRSGACLEIRSAGIAPIRLNPYTLMVMQEIGIDLSGHIPASVYQYRNQSFDYVITLCDHTPTIVEEQIPEGIRSIHQKFESPFELGKSRDEILADFRNLREDLDRWLREIFPDPLR